MTTISNPPHGTIAVLMAVDLPDATRLRRSILSVMQQTTDDWELVLAARPEQGDEAERVLAWAAGHARVEVVRTPPGAGPSASLSLALEQVRSNWIALLTQEDLIEPEALEEVLEAAERFPDARMVYTDSDEIDCQGAVVGRFAKPDWSPRRLRGHCYVGDLVALELAAVREVGGLRSDFDGAHVHDLVLRVTERRGEVIHLARVLYHHRAGSGPLPPHDQGDDPRTAEAGRLAVQEHLERIGRDGHVRHGSQAGFFVCDLIPSTTLVSVIIPTRGSSGAVRGRNRVFAVETVRSIVSHKYACDYEIVVVHDADADRDYLAALAELAGDRLRVVECDPPFNFSAKVNQGVEASAGDMLMILNDDVEVISPRWLDQLAALAQEPDVGAAGAMLLFEDGTVQHAGHFFSAGEVGHAGFRKEWTPGDHGSNVVDREVVGVTAAVLAQRRAIWDHAGGLDESLPNNFNDVDYCNRIRAKGFRIVQGNSVRLYHFESKTRDGRVAAWEASRIRNRLGDQMRRDPFTSASAAGVDAAQRSLADWFRVSRTVLREEGARSFTAKARRRLSRT